MFWKARLLLLIVVPVLGGCQSAQVSQPSDQAIEDAATARPAEPHAVLTIDGMACPFCTYNIQRQVEALDGVQKVDVSLARGEAYVTLSERDPATAEQLRQAVESAGFTPTKVQMP